MKIPVFSLLLAAPASLLQANPGGRIPLPQALDNTLTWRTGGESPWFGSALVSHDGADAARSGGAPGSWLETTVPGPGAVTFWAKKDISSAYVAAGGHERRLKEAGVWTQYRLRTGPGAQTLRWRGELDENAANGAAAMFVDEVGFTPSAPVSLGEAADAPALAWTGSDGAFGFSENGDGVTGGDFIVVPGGTVTAQVAGPAAVRFRWKMSGYGSGAKFTASTGTATQEWEVPHDAARPGSGAEVWVDAEVLVPSGAQSVVWTPDAGGEFLLDAVTVTAAPSLGTAVGQPGLAWSGDWLTRPAAQAIGGGVAVTRIVAPGQEAVLSTGITGPAEVSFVSSLLSATGNSALSANGAVPVRVDGVEGTALTVPLADGWQRTTLFVPEGAHTVAWAVVNPPASAWQSPQYCQGVLDDVQITPAVPATLAEALKTTLVPQVTEGAALSGRWRGMKSLTSGIDGSAVICGPLAEGEATTLTLPVNGPARLVFSVRGERWAWDRQVRLTAQLDGADVLPADAVTGPPGATIPPLPPADWRTLLVSIPSGAHMLTLRASYAAPGALLWLDAAVYLPADPGESKIAAAVEMSGTVWRRISPRGRGAWRILGTPMAREGKTLAACMDVPAGQSASVETTLTGPGMLTFSWGQAVEGILRVSVNDTEAARAWSAFSNETPQGERMVLVVPPGPQTVRWQFSRATPSTPSPTAAQAWLDAVSFTPLAAGNSPAPGLDVTSPVTTDTDWPWRTAAPSFSATGDGDAAMVEVPEAGAAFLEMPLTGPGRFAFWWRAETDAYLGNETVALSVDGQETAWLPAAGNWYRSEITVGPGGHTLRWQVKAPGASLRREAMRRVWLDGFTALPVLPLAAALDNSLTWNTGAPSDASDFTDWTGLPAVETAANPGPDDAAVTLGTRPLTTTVTGPGVVTFRWAEKSVPPLPTVAVPPPPPSPGSPMVLGGGTLGLVVYNLDWWNWIWWQPPPPRAVFAVNGTSRATLDLSEGGSDSEWVTHTVHLSSGTHTLTWQRPVRSNGRRLVVESVSFTPQPDHYTPAATELGVPAAGITFKGQPWTVQNTQTHDGVAALQSPAGGGASMELEFTGPGELSFWWKANGSADFRDITNGETIGTGWLTFPVTAYIAPAEWQRFTWSVSAGPHRFSWRANAEATLWLDELSYATPQPLAGPNAVAEALDFSGLTWSAPGWQPMTGAGISQTGDALVGPELSEGVAAPWLETSITGPATLRFTWKTEVFPGHGPGGSAVVALKLFMDGVESTVTAGNFSDSGTPDIYVPVGTHTVRLVFETSTPQPRRVVVDDVRLGTSYDVALEHTGLVWEATPPLGWGAWMSERYAGRTSFVESPVNEQLQPVDGSFSLQINGPAVVSFDMLPPAPAPRIASNGFNLNTNPTVLPALFVDDVPVWTGPVSAGGWQTVQSSLGSGPHSVTWKSGTAYRFLLDRLVITPGGPAAPSFADALEAPGLALPNSTGWSTMLRPGDPEHPDVAVAVVTQLPGGAPQLTTSVTGPAWVSFQHTQTNAVLNMNVGSATVAYFPTWTGYFPPLVYSPPLTETLVWRTMRVFVPDGTHFVSWVATPPQYSSGNGSIQIDALEVTPLYTSPDPVPLADALDAPGISFESTGIFSWQGLAVATGAGGDAAVVIPTDRSASLKADVTGPGLLSFRWKQEPVGRVLNYQSYSPSLHLNMDARTAVQQTPAEWTTVTWPVPPGTHALEWYFSSFGGRGIAYIDDVRLTAAPTLAEALDLPAGFTVNVASGAPAPVTRPDGTDAVFLFPVSAEDTPDLSMTVNGPGELSFDWQSSLNPLAKNYMVLVDGQPAGDWTPSPAFSRASIAVGAGAHVIRWSTASGLYGGSGVGLWLDRFTWTAGLPAWAQAAGGTSADGITAWITGGAQPWSVVAGGGLNGGAAVKTTNGWLEAIMPRVHGTLCWWGRTGAVDGVQYPGLTGPLSPSFLSTDWRFAVHRYRPGALVRPWSTKGEGFVAGANFTPSVTVPLPQALDAPAVVFETSPAAPWTGLATSSAALGTAAAVSGIGGFDDSWLRATFTGPGRLRFSWRQTGGDGTIFRSSQVMVDNSSVMEFDDFGFTWKDESIWLEAGPHTVTWTTNDLELWLDAVSYAPAQPVPLATALEYSGPWSTGGAGNWRGLSLLPGTTGDGAAISPALQAGEEAWIETTVPGSGVLTWRWRFTDAEILGGFSCQLDGLPLTWHANGTTWTNERWELPAGPHTLRWRFYALHAGEGKAMLDAVTFTPGPPPDWSAALGAQTVPIGGGGTFVWQVETENDVTFLREGPLLPGNQIGWFLGSVFADITGPAWVDYSVNTQANAYLELDGVWYARSTPGGGWADHRFLIPAGRHRVAWEKGVSRLHSLHLTPLPEISLAEAVEATNLTLHNDDAGSWFGVREQGLPGDDDYAAVQVSSDTERTLEVEFTGPGVLRSEWKVTPYLDYLHATMRVREGDGEIASLSTRDQPQGWNTMHRFGPGGHRVRFTVKDGGGGSLAQLRRMQFEPWPEVDIGTAIGTPGRAFTTGGGGVVNGFVRPDLAPQGDSVVWMQARPFEGAWLETEIAGPAEVSFWWRVSGSASSSLVVLVDGATVEDLRTPFSGEGTGTAVFRVPAGMHRVRWRREGAWLPENSPLLDAALLDRLTITPYTPLSLTEAADAPGLTLTPQAGDWTGWRSADALTGGDFIEVSRSGTEAVRLNVPLTGPGVLRWWWRNDFSGWSHGFAALLQGQVMAGTTISGRWQEGFIAVPPGAQMVTFEMPSSATTGALGGLDNLTWQPTGPGLTAAAAVEASGLTNIAPVTPGDWFPLESGTLNDDGADALVAGLPGRQHRLRAQASGPGTLSYVSNAYYPLGGANVMPVRLLTDGLPSTPTALHWATANYRMLHFTPGGGEHIFEWVRDSPFYYNHEQDYAWLDALTFTPSAPVPLAEAVDQAAWTFTTGGPVPWQGATTLAGVNGSFAYTLMNSSAPNAPESWIETTITGPGVLYGNFRSPPGAARIYRNGSLFSLEMPVRLNAGANTVRWAVVQPAPATDATVTLDDLEWQPTTWSGWQAHHFPAGTAAAISALEADPDDDGRPNGIEAWLGSSPLRADTAPPLTVTPLSGYPRIDFETAASPPEGITLAIESATDPAGPWSTYCQRAAPGQWSGSCYYEGSYSGGRDRFYFYAGGDAARFYRMRVTK